MPSPEALAWKWRQVTTPKDITSAAFAQMVLENHLKVIKSGGYAYAAKPTDDGYDLYRTFDDWGAILVTTATLTPAAGADIAAIAVPAGKRWLFVGLGGQLVADANVANRNVYMQYKPDGTNIQSNNWCAQVQTAGQTHTYRLTPAASVSEVYVASNGNHTIGFGLVGGLEMPAAAALEVLVNSKQVGDDWGTVIYTYKEAPA
jgi:hypothetical protein